MFGGPWTPSVCPSSSVAVELETVMANFVVHQTGVPVWQQGLGTDRKSYTEYSVHAWHGVRASRVLSAAVAGLPRKQPRRSSFQLCRPMGECTRSFRVPQTPLTNARSNAYARSCSFQGPNAVFANHPISPRSRDAKNANDASKERKRRCTKVRGVSDAIALPRVSRNLTGKRCRTTDVPELAAQPTRGRTFASIQHSAKY